MIFNAGKLEDALHEVQLLEAVKQVRQVESQAAQSKVLLSKK